MPEGKELKLGEHNVNLVQGQISKRKPVAKRGCKRMPKGNLRQKRKAQERRSTNQKSALKSKLEKKRKKERRNG